ncbi:MAG: InlB B-repeat-containing protein, partial [Bacteroidetes bacterium]|nr:InlB B-repeat-containing protein [Bacteroidota bacterium]
TGRYGTTNIIPGEPLKAGFTGLGSNPVTVSGRVWNDLNRNGIQDAGEPGWPDLMMRLYDDQNNEVDMVITGSNGEYAFTRDFDANSTWHIQFMLPEDYVLTKYRAAAATEQTNSDYIMYQSVPTVFFTFGAIAEDINNLDAGIYDGNNDITFHLSSGTVGVHNLTQEGSVDANNYLLPPTAWYADQAQHMTTEWYDNPSYTGTPWNFATDEVTGVLDLYAYDNVADNQGSLQRAFDYAPFTTILVRGESTDTVELTSTVTSWATRTVNDGTITLKAFTAATGNFILSPNAAVRHIRVTTAGTYKLNFIDVQFTGRNVNPAANGIAGGGISFTNTGAIISLAAENAIAGFSNITNCFATNVPELDAANGQSYGGGVYSRGAMTIDGSIKISNNRAQNGGGVNVESGTFVMNGGIINGNRAVYWGGGLRNAYATFTMNNGEFTGNDAGEDGGGVMNFADFIMKGGKIYSNTALGGGGVGQAWRTVNVGADFAMEGGEIYNNNAVYEGGGVWSYGNIVMSGGKIYGNTTAGNGGGAWKGWGGTFIITNGEIYNNSATGSWGGGICSYNSVVVSGGKIYNNTARIRGGGVYVAVDQHPSSFTLSGGEIYNNSTTAANGDGGGVYSEGAVIISDGIISDNRARDGGGIYSEGTVNATGGRINNNTATRDGGGIYTTKYENLYISSNVIFYENDASRYVEWLVSGDAAEWSILRNIYLIQNPGFPLDNQITEIPGLTLGAGGDYDNLYNNYDVNITVVELTYNANFGITPETVVKKYLQGEPCPISSNMFTYPGWNFVEWNTQSDGEGDSYAPGSTITMTGSITLYAIWEVGATVTLNLKLFLQGPTKNGNYTFKGEAKNGTYMTNYIQAPRFPWFTELYLPIDNPYGIPGSYPEINSVTGPAYEVVDWVLVEIWGNFNESTYTYDLLETRALLLQVDGSVVDVNGNLPEFDVQQGDVRIVVKHRNHLAVMSSEGLSFTSGTVEYDFSTGINKAYTLPLPIFPAQMIIKNNVAALIAGDLNTDYVINATDINIFNNAFYLTSGLWRYLVTDINMDGVVDAADSSLILDNFYLRSSYSVLRFCTKN